MRHDAPCVRDGLPGPGGSRHRQGASFHTDLQASARGRDGGHMRPRRCWQATGYVHVAGRFRAPRVRVAQSAGAVRKAARA
nr:hypothetical protein RVX_0270 [Nitratidesulfovibrio sp. HK-II]